jgi:hypothetical protein
MQEGISHASRPFCDPDLYLLTPFSFLRRELRMLLTTLR